MLGPYLRDLRKRTGLTCAEMAKEMGKSVALVSLWERGGSRIAACDLDGYLKLVHATVWERDEALHLAGGAEESE